MGRHLHRSVAGFAALVLLGLGGGAAMALVIVQDQFANPNQAYTTGNTGPTWGLPGRTPDTANLPGGSWIAASSGWGNGTYNGAAWINADGDAKLSVASAGAYVKPSALVVSADINLNWTDATTRAPLGVWTSPSVALHGINVGFSGGTAWNSPFYGLTVQSNGTVTIHGGTVIYGVEVPLAVVPWTSGTFDPSAWHHVTFQVDTATGALSNILLDSQSYSVSTNVFTDANTNVASWRVRSWAGDTYGLVDNFLVTDVPEPMALTLLGGLGLLAVVRRPRR